MTSVLNFSLMEGAIALVSLNRPQAANALNIELAQALAEQLAKLPAAARVAILTGVGKHFCAGADLKERRGMSEADWHQQHAAFEKALHHLRKCTIPVIAAVNGAAIGGGLELALACDFIYAADTASFALTEATLGIMPGLGGTQNLSRAVGMRRAKELIFTGKRFSAEEAKSWGMVNAVFSADELFEKTLEQARTIAANAPKSVTAIKRSIDEGAALAMDAAIASEMGHYRALLNTKDRHEGINAFNEKRKPVFTGE